MTDLDSIVADMLTRNLARAQARSQRLQQSVAAPSAPQPAATKPKRVRKPPKPPPSEPRHEVITVLTRSELMSLERIAFELGLTPGEALRWAWQAYSGLFDDRRDD